MKKPGFIDLAIIIPTLNEEGYIGQLLESLASQTVQPKELVVIDAMSSDKTEEIVKSKQQILPQLQFFPHKKSTVAAQRNFGVKQTTSSSLFFLDADTKFLEEMDLENFYQEIQRKKSTIAACRIVPLSSSLSDKVFYYFMYVFFKVSQYVWPVIVGTNLYIERGIFLKNHGFNKQVKVGEDIEFLQRLVKAGEHLTFSKHTVIATSTRRIKREGKVGFSLKMIRAFFICIRNGFAKNTINYDFGEFSKEG